MSAQPARLVVGVHPLTDLQSRSQRLDGNPMPQLATHTHRDGVEWQPQ